MELEASSVAVYDPGDPNLGKHQGSRSNDSGKQIPQELSLSEITPFEASHESSGIPDQEFQQVESRDLSTLDQLRAKKMPTDSPPRKRKSVYLRKPDRGVVTCDEVICILRESQLDELKFMMVSEEDESIEAYREDRLHLFDAIGKCESLKSITIRYSKLLEHEILLLRPTLEERIEGLQLDVRGWEQRGMKVLCEMLAKNNVLEDVRFVSVEDGHLAVLCAILPTFHTFKPVLDLELSPRVTISGAASLVSILGMNSIVRTLDIYDGNNLLGSNGLEMILDPLIGHLGNPPANQSVNELKLLHSHIGRDGGAIKAVVEMLGTNNTLMKFSIYGDPTLKPTDVCAILGSLENNQSLRKLGFHDCDHVEGADLLGKMMDLLRVNPWLTEIDLRGTGLQREQQAAQVRAQLERNAQNYMKVENQVMQNTTSIANDRSQFYLWNDVLGTSTSAIDSVTLDIADLVSTLNMPCAFSAIDCNFQLAGSYSALDRKKRLKAIDAIGRCQSLKRLTISGKLDFEQIQQLCKSLQATRVEYLELCISGLLYRGLTSICEMLLIFPNLKHFKFIGKAMKPSVGVIFGSMLAKNSTLEHLDLVSCKWGPNGIEALLQPLKGTSTQLPLNRSLKHLSINAAYKHGLRCEDAKAIARMLSSNKTLTHFNLSADYSLEPDDICLILLSLRTNENLQTLGLENCLGVRGTQVFREMLELTQANPWLKSIELSGTQLGEEQKEAVRAQLAANAKQRSETNVETVREKASIYPVTLQPPGEVEVLQEIPAIRPPDPLEDGINNLEECSPLTINTSSSINVQDNHMKSQVVGDQTNMATTVELSTTHILDFFHQACNSITKVLMIKQLPRVSQQTNVGVHDNNAILQVLEKFTQQNPRGIIVAARIQANGQQIQFLFADACGMASTVGVGLDFAIVYWTRRNEVFVEALEKDEWLQFWTEAFTNGSSFQEPIIMHMPHESNIITTKLDHIQTSDDICQDDVLGTLSTCEEVLLLKLIFIFFMKGQVCDKTSKPQNHDPAMTTKGSYSTWPSVEFNVAQEGFEYCNSFEKAIMIGQTQLLTNLMGFLWNLIPTSGNTNGSGEGHHEGDQGASRQNGNSGHDENNHGEENDNNDDGDGEASDGESLSSNLSLGDSAIVNVLPGFGGCWFFPSDFDADEDLNEAYIEPELCFKFSKTKDGNKDLVTTISTCFDLNNAIPKRNEKDSFGWFQTLLNVTLECSDAGAAKLRHNEKVLEALEEVQKHTQRVNSQLDSGASQITFQVEAGIPVAKAKLGGSRFTKKKSLVTESAVEITNQQILGGFVPTKRTKIGSKPCLSYDFDFPIYPTDLNVIDEQKRNWYLRYGLCSTVCPMIEGTWHQLSNTVDSLYTFRARRNVCKLTYEPTFTRNKFHSRILGMIKSKEPKTKLMEIEQLYEVKLYMNHRMTHLCKLQTLRENESCDLMHVGVIERDPTFNGSSSASSSNI